jgi:geranylgeranyl reductase family protein
MDVLVLEQKPVPGNKACSGLVSGRVKEILPDYVIDTPGLIQHRVRGAKIHVMGKVIEMRKGGKPAYVIDRDLLDKRLAEHAASSGCDIRFNAKVRGISNQDGHVTVKTEKGPFESRVVAGCGGANSITARHIGAKPPELLNGLVIRSGKEDKSDCVEMWFDRQAAKDGFMWRIPRGSHTEFGGMGKGLGFAQVERFFRLGNAKGLKKSAAPIPIGLVKTFSDRLLLVGDSACQVKPWSGGGVVYGLLAAQVAAKVIKHALKKDDLSEESLSAYEDGWKKILLKDMQAGLMLRDMCREVPEDYVPRLSKNLETLKRFEREIDFDFPFSSLLNEMGGLLGA